MPNLLELLDLNGTTVTIDAMGCQRSIAAYISRRDGDYLLAIKGNQQTLHEDLVRAFDDALDSSPRANDQPERLEVDDFEQIEKGHGRIETRRTYVCRDLSWLSTRTRWEGLSAIVMTESTREYVKTGKMMRQRRYFIASKEDLTARRAAHLFRRHWGIECSMWPCGRTRYGTERATALQHGVLRKIAINLLKADTTTNVGTANKLKAASRDRNNLLTVLAGPT